MKPDLVSLDNLPDRPMKRLEENFTVHRMAQGAAVPADLAARARFVQLTGFVRCPAEMIAVLPKAEIISVMAVGTDMIDLAAARARGIAVTNTPDVLNDDVADLAIALMLMCARKLVVADRYVRQGAWLKGVMPLARKASGKTLGILGLGRIGKAIARRAEPFGMTIAYHGRTRQNDVPYRYYDDLVAMAADVDVLVVICPGGPATRHLVNAPVLKALGRKGTLINVARGSVVDEAALVAALSDGTLGGAGLDVFAAEPNVPPALLTMDNVVLAPHVGSATVETRDAMGQLVVDNLIAHRDGKPLPSRVV